MTLPPVVRLAARHLDPGEGPMVEGHVVTASDVAALCKVRDYLGGLDRSISLIDAEPPAPAPRPAQGELWDPGLPGVAPMRMHELYGVELTYPVQLGDVTLAGPGPVRLYWGEPLPPAEDSEQHEQ